MRLQKKVHVNLKISLTNFVQIKYIEFYSNCFIRRTVVRYLSTGHLHSFVRSLRLFVGHGNASTENSYNGCRTNAAAEAPYDRRPRAVFSCLVVTDLTASTVALGLVFTAVLRN